MKGTTIFANTLFKYTLAFTLRLKTTRRVLLFLVIPPHTCMDPTVTSYCLSWRFRCGQYQSCPVYDSPSSAGPDVEWWHADVVVLASDGLLRSLFGGRVVLGALLSIHCSQTLLQCFVWFNPPISIPIGLFLSFSESRGMTVPKLIQHQLNFFFTTLICL